jgi:hypothetical protein
MSEFNTEDITDRAGTGKPDLTNGFTINGSASGVDPHKHTESATEPSSPSNGDAWLDTDNNVYKVYINNEWKDWFGTTAASFAWGGDRGIQAGGAQTGDGTTANRDYIDYWDMTTSGNAADFGTMTTTRQQGYGFSGSSRAIIGGGIDINSVRLNVIEYITPSTLGNGTDFGDDTVNTLWAAGCSNGTRGLIAGGWDNSGGSNTAVNQIRYITIATTGNAADFGDLSSARRHLGSFSDATRAIFHQGDNYNGATYAGRINTIEYVTVDTLGNVTDFGDAAQASQSPGGGSDLTRGVFGGGYSSTISAETNTLEYITIQTTGNATDFGDLLSAQRLPAGAASNGTYVGWAGTDSSSYSNVIQQVTVQTTGNATDHGDLTLSTAQPINTAGAAS